MSETGDAGQEAAMTAYDTQVPTALDASASRDVPPCRSLPARVLLYRVLRNAAAFALLLALALAPLAFQLHLIRR
jgi:hypothetical protein